MELEYLTTEELIEELENRCYEISTRGKRMSIYKTVEGATCLLGSIYSDQKFSIVTALTGSKEDQIRREKAWEPIEDLIIRYLKTPIDKREGKIEIWYFSFPICHPFRDYLQPVKANSIADATTKMVKIFGLNWGDIYAENHIKESKVFKDSKRLPIIEVV